MYQQAGSFVAYLFARFGRERFKALCGAHSHESSRAIVARAFLDTYNCPVEQVATQWKAYFYRRRARLRLTSQHVTGRVTEAQRVKDGIQRVRETLNA